TRPPHRRAPFGGRSRIGSTRYSDHRSTSPTEIASPLTWDKKNVPSSAATEILSYERRLPVNISQKANDTCSPDSRTQTLPGCLPVVACRRGDNTNSKRQRGQAAAPSLTLRVGIAGSRYGEAPLCPCRVAFAVAEVTISSISLVQTLAP